jgi:HAD superfamily hydrolase (TIGR01509 family)
MIRGVLFDFSGTLFRLEPQSGWFDGHVADEELNQRLTQVLTAPTLSGDHLPADLVEAWGRRDLDPEVHRTVYLASLEAAGIEFPPGGAEAVYARSTDPESWRPYPDTVAVLRRLRDAGVPVAVVSNIAWDIREAFRRHDAADLVDEFVMSYVEGVVKPDLKIFTVACQRIGLPPEEVLMVGDSAEADGAAVGIGCATALVPALPTEKRPSALTEVLATHHLG